MERTDEDKERKKRIQKLKEEQEILKEIRRDQEEIIKELERQCQMQGYQITAKVKTLAEMRRRRPRDDWLTQNPLKLIYIGNGLEKIHGCEFSLLNFKWRFQHIRTMLLCLPCDLLCTTILLDDGLSRAYFAINKKWKDCPASRDVWNKFTNTTWAWVKEFLPVSHKPHKTQRIKNYQQ